MTCKSSGLGIGPTVFRAVGLCGVLALVMSVASPADDDVQQPFMGSRTPQHVARVLKLSHPDKVRGPTSLSAESPAAQLTPTLSLQYTVQVRNTDFQDEPKSQTTGGRSPPAVLS